MTSNSFTEPDLERVCLGIKKKPLRIAFARSATREEVVDAVAGELLLGVRKFVGAHATKSINPPAKRQLHSDARIEAIVAVVMAHSSELFNPHVQINELIYAVLARREKIRAGRVL
jgi:hypothetical protein